MAGEYNATTAQLFSAASAAISRASQSASNINRVSVSVPTPPFTYTGDIPKLSYSGNVPAFNYTPGSIDIGEAPKFSDLLDGADNSNPLINELNGIVDGWMDKYFPAINGSFQNLTEDWCASIIGGTQPFGTSSTIFEMVWQQARDRAYRTATSEQRQLDATFSSRGFSMPVGALADLISQSEQAATSAILDVSRDQAIKDADIKVDLLKHATTIASSLKLGILNASADYFKAIYAVHGTAIEKARIQAQLYATYYSALSSYTNVEVSVEELRLRAAQVQATVALNGEDLKLRAAESGAGIDVSSEQIKLRAAEARAGILTDANRIKVGLYSGDNAPTAHAGAARAFADAAGSAYTAAGTLAAEIKSS